MAKPDFSNFGNVIIISSGRHIGKNHFFEQWMKYSENNAPKEWKLLNLVNTPLLYHSGRTPKYPPIPRKSNQI